MYTGRMVNGTRRGIFSADCTLSTAPSRGNAVVPAAAELTDYHRIDCFSSAAAAAAAEVQLRDGLWLMV